MQKKGWLQDKILAVLHTSSSLTSATDLVCANQFLTVLRMLTGGKKNPKPKTPEDWKQKRRKYN